MTIRDFAHGGDPDQAVEAWSETGFEAHEVEEWLAARCFSPDTARDLADAGVAPRMACMPARPVPVTTSTRSRSRRPTATSAWTKPASSQALPEPSPWSPRA